MRVATPPRPHKTTSCTNGHYFICTPRQNMTCSLISYNMWVLFLLTSCILSKARAWSKVSMEGDSPPWRQKICAVHSMYNRFGNHRHVFFRSSFQVARCTVSSPVRVDCTSLPQHDRGADFERTVSWWTCVSIPPPAQRKCEKQWCFDECKAVLRVACIGFRWRTSFFHGGEEVKLYSN